jgi:Glycosyltransferase sugar-binding region containing DXD motif
MLILVLLISLYSTTRNPHHAATRYGQGPIATLFPQVPKTAGISALRVFGPKAASHDEMAMAQQKMALVLNNEHNNDNSGDDRSIVLFSFSTTAQQREFLVQHGQACQASFQRNEKDENSNAVLATFDAYVNFRHDNDDDDDDNDINNGNDDDMNHHFATELWKYCVLYTGAAHVYWNAREAHALMEWKSSSNSNPVLASFRQRTGGGGGGMALLVVHHPVANFNQYMDDDDSGNENDDSSMLSSSSWPWRIHHALLYVHQAKSFVCAEMMHWLVERGPLFVGMAKTTRPILPDAVSLSEYLGLLIHNDNKNNNSNNYNNSERHWSLWSTQCRVAPVEAPPRRFAANSKMQRRANSVHRHLTPRCPNHQFCCQAWNTESPEQQQGMGAVVPSFLIRHPLAFSTTTTNGEKPGVVAKHDHDPSNIDYMATVRLLPHVNNNNNNGIAQQELADNPFLVSSPTFFDIMLENGCLPNTHDCFRCLKGTTSTSTTMTTATSSMNSESRSGGGSAKNSEKSSGTTSNSGSSSGGSCRACASVCHCYCRALCRIRPPPKPQPPAVWAVAKPQQRPPSAVAAASSYSSSSSRLIPRIIHQTWFESVNATQYPRQSRLVQSFVESGWEYHFYTDEAAAEFISTHFPPPVRQAYDALVPGAFKADLFRYCILLIHGGLYADMDVLLTSNLDEVLGPNIGFMTARDEPGQQVGHGSCLWNGFIAAAPGHPFLAQTVETVVNNIRNRFTSVDYDDMLCPNPVLSVSHSFDVLFTTGPCILGASINRVLKRHAQTAFETGDLDVFENTTPGSGAAEFLVNDDTDASSDSNEEALVEGQVVDRRLLVPGRSILLHQNKKDMGAHRFTWLERNLIVASTDLPDSSDDHSSSSSSWNDDDKDAEDVTAAAAADGNKVLGNDSKTKQKHLHYSTTHENAGVYGLNRLYTNSFRANQDIKIILLG